MRISNNLRILSMFLSLLMILGALSSLTILPALAEEQGTDDTTKDEVVTDPETPTKEYIAVEEAILTYLTKVYESKEAKLATMTPKLTRGDLQLYVDSRTGEVAMKNNKTGQILLSNPYDVASASKDTDIKTATVKNNLLSQVFISFKDMINGNVNRDMNSFADCAQYGQIKIKKIKTGVRVEYTIGNEATRKLAPRLISATNYKTLIIAPLEVAIGGTHAFDRFQAFYSLQSLAEQKSNTAKEGLLKKYPVCANMDIYSLDVNITPVELSFIEENIKGYCPDYTFDQMDADHAETGYESENELSPVFKMALEYTLNEDGFTVRQPSNGVRFNSNLYSLEHISILPYMVAGNSYNTGYTFYPDGSGALFAFEDLSGKSTYTASRKIFRFP